MLNNQFFSAVRNSNFSFFFALLLMKIDKTNLKRRMLQQNFFKTALAAQKVKFMLSNVTYI